MHWLSTCALKVLNEAMIYNKQWYRRQQEVEKKRNTSFTTERCKLWISTWIGIHKLCHSVVVIKKPSVRGRDIIPSLEFLCAQFTAFLSGFEISTLRHFFQVFLMQWASLRQKNLRRNVASQLHILWPRPPFMFTGKTFRKFGNRCYFLWTFANILLEVHFSHIE